VLISGFDEQVPSITEWLTEVLTSTDRVAADPTLVGADTWLGWKQKLGSYKLLYYLTLFELTTINTI
jgi:hypothetical protein